MITLQGSIREIGNVIFGVVRIQIDVELNDLNEQALIQMWDAREREANITIDVIQEGDRPKTMEGLGRKAAYDKNKEWLDAYLGEPVVDDNPDPPKPKE